MARLNEVPQPASESIDALKRRFVRQNREIARANSTQSIRIRNLDIEVSRLLAENVSLRERTIRLYYEIERNTSQSIQDDVDNIKAKLEAKLTELSGLVKDLGQVQKNTEGRKRSKRKSINAKSPKQSPDQRKWKNALMLSEATGGADGRLPPIVEDKYYPRRTTDAEELMGAFPGPANLMDSPDLGPPPVAHFDEGDPVKYDHKPEGPNIKGSSESIDDLRPALPANLETRKKRRESSHHRDTGKQSATTRLSQDTASKDSDPSKGQPLKTGAKRKLNVRDEEEQLGSSVDQEREIFQFNRKNMDLRTSDVTAVKRNTSKPSKPSKERVTPAVVGSAQVRKEKANDPPIGSTTTNRKALGPKSVNTDPVSSPVRWSKNGKDKAAEAKDDLAKLVREQNRRKEKASLNKPTTQTKDEDPSAHCTAASQSVDPAPETPAPPSNDLFSPVSSEPSAARAESRDTPPPPDLGPDDGTGSFGRASRRPRVSVNYAQPNLRDKMRRPTKELVDAVGAEERLRRANLASAEPDSIVIKQEEVADILPVWKTSDSKDDHRTREEPPSPLSNKTGEPAADLPGSVATGRRRRSMAPLRIDDTTDTSKPPSGAASAISALTAGSQRPKRREEDQSSAVTVEHVAQEVEEKLSIFDFTGSSPDVGGHASDNDGGERSIRAMRSSRRHSSVPASSDRGPGSLSISRRVERRRENVQVGSHAESSEKGNELQLSRTKSALDLGTANEEVPGGRGERAASRRRSMML